MRWVLLVVVTVVSLRAQTAEACACCDAKFQRQPIGWSEEGAILIDTFDTIACEHKRRLEVWNVDGQEPTTCFDLYGDPEKEVSCRGITAGAPQDKWKKKSVAAKKKFSKAPARMAGSKFRVKQAWANPDSPRGDLKVDVELQTKTGWASAWSGTIQPTDQNPKVKLDVSLWPNAKGDRVVVLVGYVTSGTGNRQVDVHRAPLPK